MRIADPSPTRATTTIDHLIRLRSPARPVGYLLSPGLVTTNTQTSVTASNGSVNHIMIGLLGASR
ncbi:hypothetical protein [Herbiconiux sp. A18JL235]|uniref:Uncharacterized protein n=1 Tax=Herbiconiux sp. A18JL235 TaxID=3152363 RepID=A0AB39BLZ0_9MICO